MKNTRLSQMLRFLPLLLMLGAALWLLLHLSRLDLSLDAVLNYTPKDPLHAACFLWLGFAVKSITIFFPIHALFAASGVLFPLPIALAVNLVGIFITLTLPYLIGRVAGKDLTERLLERRPKMQQLREIRCRNNFFFSFLVRALGILSCDLVSLYFGNTRLPYGAYISGAMLGFLPDVILGTVAGMQLAELSTPWLLLTLALKLLLCVLSVLIYQRYIRRVRPTS